MQNNGSDIALSELFTQHMTPAAENGACSLAAPIVYSGFDGKVVMAIFRGAISLSTDTRFLQTLEKLLTGDVTQVILSMNNVTKLSRTAVGLLVDFAAGVLGRGKELYLYKPAPVIDQRLADMNVAIFFKILREEDELFDILPLLPN